MEITAVTTWQGTPAAIKFVVEAAKGAVEVHESLGCLLYTSPSPRD